MEFALEISKEGEHDGTSACNERSRCDDRIVVWLMTMLSSADSMVSFDCPSGTMFKTDDVLVNGSSGTISTTAGVSFNGSPLITTTDDIEKRGCLSKIF